MKHHTLTAKSCDNDLNTIHKNMKEMETIDGFDIPKRPLTESEKCQKITIERFRDFHYAVGEDFIDICEQGSGTVFGGWLLHKYPEHSDEILDILNQNKHKPSLSIQDFMDVSFNDYLHEEDIDSIYIDYSEFLNQTQASKMRVNEILIIVDETYG